MTFKPIISYEKTIIGVETSRRWKRRFSTILLLVALALTGIFTLGLIHDLMENILLVTAVIASVFSAIWLRKVGEEK